MSINIADVPTIIPNFDKAKLDANGDLLSQSLIYTQANQDVFIVPCSTFPGADISDVRTIWKAFLDQMAEAVQSREGTNDGTTRMGVTVSVIPLTDTTSRKVYQVWIDETVAATGIVAEVAE